MRHLKQLQLESKELEVFEVASLLRGFLEDKGIKANVEKFENFFNIYISGYANEESPKRVPVQKLLSYFKSLDICEDAAIQKTKFGYTIEMLKDGQSEKLMEAVVEEDEGHKCYICEKTYFGYGNDPWPITTEPGERVCDQCNTEYVIPARLELLLGKNKKPRREAVDKTSVEHAASNVILDNKYIWLFNVLDTDGEDIEEGIEYLQDAIDSLVANNGTFLVAFPYVDPKPEDKSVELVFADNPGPIVIYNREESTVAKGKLDRSSQERKPKEESTIKEWLNGSITTVKKDRDFLETIDKDYLIRNGIAHFGRKLEIEIDLEELYDLSKDEVIDYYLELQDTLHEELRRLRHRESIEEAVQAPTEQQKAVQGINDVYNYLKKHKEKLSEKDMKTLAGYCRTLLKAINKVAEIKESTITESTFYGVPMNSEEADDILFALQVQYGAPEKGFEEFLAMNISDEDIQKALDYVVLKGYNKFTYFEESTITEATENYQVAVEFEQAFYLEHADDDIEISQILDAYIAQAEENLEGQGIYLDFDYYGGGAYDYISSPISYEEAKIVHKFLNDDSVTIKILKGDDE